MSTTEEENAIDVRGMDLTELYGYEECLDEQYGDTLSQFNAECGVYGDAWPGAQIELQGMRRDLSIIRAAIASRLQGPVNVPTPSMPRCRGYK